MPSRNPFIHLRDFIRNDEQAIHKLAFTFTSFVALFLLNKLELILTSLFTYIFTTYGSILLVLAILFAASSLFLFQNELLRLAESAKSIDQQILNSAGALLCFMFIGFVFLPMFGATSQASQLDELKHFDMPQFKVDLTERAYINNALVTSEHLSDLRKNFNLILKTLNKSKAKGEAVTADGRLFIEGDIMAVYNYLERTMPLFLVNQLDEAANSNQGYSTIKLLVGLGVFCLSVYLAGRALLWQVLNEVNSQLARNDLGQADQVMSQSSAKDDRLVEEAVLSGTSATPSPSPALPEIVIGRDLKEMLIATEPDVNADEEQAIDENGVEENIREVVVEYCINCEMIGKQLIEYEQRMDEIEAAFIESKSVAPYQSHNPFKKSLQNLNRGEVTQMSYPGNDEGNAYEFDFENGDSMVNEAGAEAERDEYDAEGYEEDVYVQGEQRYVEEGEEFEQDERRVYEDEDEMITYGDKENEGVDKDKMLTEQAQAESAYNCVTPSLSEKIMKKAHSSLSLSGGQAFNDLLVWLLFNDLEIDEIVGNPANYTNLLNTLVDCGFEDEVSQQKQEDVYFKSVDTLPPKFTNIQTLVSAADSLTLRASLEFSNIDLTAELKRSGRQLDIQILNVSAQVLIVLSQNRTSLFNMEMVLDPETECTINIRPHPEIDTALNEHLKSLFKEAARQTILNMELNFLGKKISPTLRTASTQLNFNQSLKVSEALGISSLKQDTSGSDAGAHKVVPNAHVTRPTSASSNEKRLLVKLIKATNLSNCEEPYCVVELDYPMQKHIADIQSDMSTIGEQFLFDVIANSEELTFSIYDRAKDYGNDLVGEGVLPVSDMCSGASSKRVIQLHRYGQTKTGSITAEFIFIEPESGNDQDEPKTDTPRQNNSNRLSSAFFNEDTNNQLQSRLLNPEILSSGSYSSPTTNSTQSAPYQHLRTESMKENRTASGTRVINRNYLQIQANSYNNRANTLNPSQRGRIGTSQHDINQFGSNNEPKRTRSISRSVKNLFSSKPGKREQSYDSTNTYNVNNCNNYDVNSDVSSTGSFTQLRKLRSMSRSVIDLFNKTRDGRENDEADTGSFQNNSLSMNSDTVGLKKSKSIGRSIKKLFTMGKNNNTGRGTVVDGGYTTQRTESVGPATSGRYTTQLTPQRLYDSNQNVNAMPDDQANQRSNSILLKRDYKSP